MLLTERIAQARAHIAQLMHESHDPERIMYVPQYSEPAAIDPQEQAIARLQQEVKYLRNRLAEAEGRIVAAGMPDPRKPRGQRAKEGTLNPETLLRVD